ncbi:hypothetical protein CDCA_CDCA06G1819 [Cyanidium caldarium]|uniref:Uncharacterized protein n=1 Tax=Cyanidium caldarium TaxID=2771 RepID=A0AAV9IU68_CYACA|nr:hypothetical protein CDCA_CDCA06G1819 [Cyanidium caldarium]
MPRGSRAPPRDPMRSTSPRTTAELETEFLNLDGEEEVLLGRERDGDATVASSETHRARPEPPNGIPGEGDARRSPADYELFFGADERPAPTGSRGGSSKAAHLGNAELAGGAAATSASGASGGAAIADNAYGALGGRRLRPRHDSERADAASHRADAREPLPAAGWHTGPASATTDGGSSAAHRDSSRRHLNPALPYAYHGEPDTDSSHTLRKRRRRKTPLELHIECSECGGDNAHKPICTACRQRHHRMMQQSDDRNCQWGEHCRICSRRKQRRGGGGGAANGAPSTSGGAALQTASVTDDALDGDLSAAAAAAASLLHPDDAAYADAEFAELHATGSSHSGDISAVASTRRRGGRRPATDTVVKHEHCRDCKTNQVCAACRQRHSRMMKNHNRVCQWGGVCRLCQGERGRREVFAEEQQPEATASAAPTRRADYRPGNTAAAAEPWRNVDRNALYSAEQPLEEDEAPVSEIMAAATARLASNTTEHR